MRIGDDGLKQCSRCREKKPATGFGTNRAQSDGLNNQCKDCQADRQRGRLSKGHHRWGQGPTVEDKKAYMREWNRNHPEKRQQYSLKKHYGLTVKEYAALLEQQEFRCAICGREREEGQRAFCVDHKHGTSPVQVRALLCHHCNFIIGNCREDPEILAAAIRYLNTHTVISSQAAPEGAEGSETRREARPARPPTSAPPTPDQLVLEEIVRHSLETRRAGDKEPQRNGS